MPGLDDLIGTSYGPFRFEVTPDRVASFVAATGDDAMTWEAAAPPLFANVALFAAAPALLQDAVVRPYTRSLIHSEQSYSWSGRLPVGADLTVTGTVDAVRGRGALHFVTFSLVAATAQGCWLTGTSVFLMSRDAAAAAADAAEPSEDDRPAQDAVGPDLPLPGIGEALAEMRCGASRSDLMRYAAATEDWNPIHYDHESARAAGLEGVIVHGLLMGAWMGRAAGRYGKLQSMRLRFRNPLRPAVPAIVTGTVTSIEPDSADLDLALSGAGQRLVTASASVTP